MRVCVATWARNNKQRSQFFSKELSRYTLPVKNIFLSYCSLFFSSMFFFISSYLVGFQIRRHFFRHCLYVTTTCFFWFFVSVSFALCPHFNFCRSSWLFLLGENNNLLKPSFLLYFWALYWECIAFVLKVISLYRNQAFILATPPHTLEKSPLSQQ